ncbi:MAG: type II toxin-antitoxin system VapC family toxin [Caulobacteraceae bacterium]
MDLLLDTHVFVWWDSQVARLGEGAKALISGPSNRVFVSAVSIWEIAIKRRIGKLAFEGSPVDAIGKNAFFELPISGRECEAAGALDWSHADPFDRLLLAQAQVRGLTLITADTTMRGFIGVAIVAASQ